MTSGDTSDGSSSMSGGGGAGGCEGPSAFWRLAFWEEAWDWRSKKWRIPNLAGCDGCEAGGFFEAAPAAAPVRFRGAMTVLRIRVFFFPVARRFDTAEAADGGGMGDRVGKGRWWEGEEERRGAEKGEGEWPKGRGIGRGWKLEFPRGRDFGGVDCDVGP